MKSTFGIAALLAVAWSLIFGVSSASPSAYTNLDIREYLDSPAAQYMFDRNFDDPDVSAYDSLEDVEDLFLQLFNIRRVTFAIYVSPTGRRKSGDRAVDRAVNTFLGFDQDPLSFEAVRSFVEDEYLDYAPWNLTSKLERNTGINYECAGVPCEEGEVMERSQTIEVTFQVQ